MTFEQGCLAVIGAVVSALVYLFSLLWARSLKCEEDRLELRKLYETSIKDGSEARGTLRVYERCGQEQCPFRPDEDHHSRYGPKGLSASGSTTLFVIILVAVVFTVLTHLMLVHGEEVQDEEPPEEVHCLPHLH